MQLVPNLADTILSYFRYVQQVIGARQYLDECAKVRYPVDRTQISLAKLWNCRYLFYQALGLFGVRQVGRSDVDLARVFDVDLASGLFY